MYYFCFGFNRWTLNLHANKNRIRVASHATDRVDGDGWWAAVIVFINWFWLVQKQHEKQQTEWKAMNKRALLICYKHRTKHKIKSLEFYRRWKYFYLHDANRLFSDFIYFNQMLSWHWQYNILEQRILY